MQINWPDVNNESNTIRRANAILDESVIMRNQFAYFLHLTPVQRIILLGFLIAFRL